MQEYVAKRLHVCVGRIYINVQKIQYTIFNKMMCMPAVHVAAYKLYVLLHTNCTC